VIYFFTTQFTVNLLRWLVKTCF